MPVDFPVSERSNRGALNYQNGLCAEESVAREYAARGAKCLARRWRGNSAEIDLIFEVGKGIVVVEVKRGATFDAAALHLCHRQMWRVSAAAEEFAATLETGLLTPIRIDAALVDGTGRVEIIENVSLS